MLGNCKTKQSSHGVRLRRKSMCLDLVQIEYTRGARRGRQLTASLRVLQRVAVCCRPRPPTHRLTPCVTVCCSVSQAAAANSQAHSVCYSVLQCAAGRGRQLTVSPLTTAYPAERTCTVSQSYRLGVCLQVVYCSNYPVWTALTLVPAYV